MTRVNVTLVFPPAITVMAQHSHDRENGVGEPWNAAATIQGETPQYVEPGRYTDIMVHTRRVSFLHPFLLRSTRPESVSYPKSEVNSIQPWHIVTACTVAHQVYNLSSG